MSILYLQLLLHRKDNRDSFFIDGPSHITALFYQPNIFQRSSVIENTCAIKFDRKMILYENEKSYFFFCNDSICSGR